MQARVLNYGRSGSELFWQIQSHTTVATEMDQDEANLYEYLLHQKRPAPVGEPRVTGERPAKAPASQAAKGKGRGRGRSRPQRHQPNQGLSGGSWLEATVKALARLTLRQGDYIARLQTDHTVLMNFNIEENPANIIPALAGVAERWNHLRLNEPGKINRTLRHTLLIFVIDTLLKRLSEKEPSECGKAGLADVTIGPASGDGRGRSVGVHDVERVQAPSGPGTGAVGKEQFIRVLEEIRTLLVEPGLILRFSATRPLTAEMSGHSVTLLLELSLQDPRASQVMQMMRKWYALAAWLMIGACLRPARVERSPLMKEVPDLVFGQDQ